MRSFLGIVIVTSVFYYNQAKRDFTIVLDDMTIDVTGPDIVKFVNYSMPTRKTFSVDFLLYNTFSDLNLKLSLNVLKRRNKPMNILTVNISGCQAFAAHKVQYIRKVFQQVMSISNLPLKDCIFRPDTLYYIRNYRIVDEDYPPFLIASTWTFIWEFYSGTTPAAIATLGGRVARRK